MISTDSITGQMLASISEDSDTRQYAPLREGFNHVAKVVSELLGVEESAIVFLDVLKFEADNESELTLWAVSNGWLLNVPLPAKSGPVEINVFSMDSINEVDLKTDNYGFYSEDGVYRILHLHLNIKGDEYKISSRGTGCRQLQKLMSAILQR